MKRGPLPLSVQLQRQWALLDPRPIAKTDCRVLRMKQEYPGYTGDILWIIVSDLTEEQILERYPEEVKPYTPFVHMTREMYAPIEGGLFTDK